METTKLKNSRMNVKEMDKQNSSTELIQRDDIEETPFVIVTTDKGSFGVMGKYRVTEYMNSKEEVKEDLSKITWNRLIQVIMLITETLKEN